MIKSDAFEVYAYLSPLISLHRKYKSASSKRIKLIREEYYHVCLSHWSLMRWAPLKARFPGRGARYWRFLLIEKLDRGSGWKRLDSAWQAYLWEHLDSFLIGGNPNMDSGLYLKALVGLLGRTHDRTVRNMLAYDFGYKRGRFREVSLDQPIGRGNEDSVTLLDKHADPRSVFPGSGLRELVQRTVDEWMHHQSRSRPDRTSKYQAISRCWWLIFESGYTIRELQRRFGSLIENETQFRTDIEKITACVRHVLDNAGYHQNSNRCANSRKTASRPLVENELECVA